MLIGFDKIRIRTKKGDHYANVALRHILTPFGEDIALDVFYQSPERFLKNLFFAIHTYQNYTSTNFSGLEVAFYRQPLYKKLEIDARLMMWNQPKNQSFTTSEGQLGGLLGFTLAYPFAQRFHSFVELEGKTYGWVMGNVFLDKNLSIRLGTRVVYR